MSQTLTIPHTKPKPPPCIEVAATTEFAGHGVILDMKTLYVVTAMTCVILGIMQLGAYATGRFDRWPGWWGLSNLLLGIGTFSVAWRGLIPNFISIGFADIAQLGGYIMLVVGVATFAGVYAKRRWPVVAISLLSLFLIVMFGKEEQTVSRIASLSLVCCACDIAIAIMGQRIAIREKLASAWILVGLFATTAAIFMARSLLAVTGYLGGETLVFNNGGPHQWLMLTATVFVALRSIVLLLMAAERSRNQLLALAQYDPLTDTMNRSGLAQAFANGAADLAGNPLSQASLLVTDMDHFKLLNDSDGHAAGDKALRLFADTVRQSLKDRDIFARMGGDEFVVILPCIPGHDAVALAEQIRASFGVRVSMQSEFHVRPTLSIGVASGNMRLEGLEALLQRADEALYRCKREGRDRVGYLAKECAA